MTDDVNTQVQTNASHSDTREREDSRDFFAHNEGLLDGFLSYEASEAMRARQKSRARAMGILLGLAAILFFAITIVKTGAM